MLDTGCEAGSSRRRCRCARPNEGVLTGRQRGLVAVRLRPSRGSHCRPDLNQTAAACSTGRAPNGFRLEDQGSGTTVGYHASTGPDVTGITLQAARSTNSKKRAVGRCQEFPSILHLLFSLTGWPGGSVVPAGSPCSHSRVAASGVVSRP